MRKDPSSFNLHSDSARVAFDVSSHSVRLVRFQLLDVDVERDYVT